MAIELLIKISEDSYKATCNGYMLPTDVENVVNAIKNGTPLPKEHKGLCRNLCDSCTNNACIFQSGIVRNNCDFYKAESEE